MTSFLITGSSRGLGLELVKHLASFPAATIGTIFATARAASPSVDLTQVIKTTNGRVKYVQLDVNDQSSISAAASKVDQLLGPSEGLDVLVNNAGIQLHNDPAPSLMKEDTLDSTLSTNVTGVHRVTSTFLPLLTRGKAKKIVNITSTLGSIGLAKQSGVIYCPSYSISKAALNMLTVQYASELGPKGFTVFAISPGWLQTDLGGSHAHLKPIDGARSVTNIILKSSKAKDNGCFRDIYIEGDSFYTGENPPW
ncbi:putative short-chain dehydrogenase [Talaromyces proteolyticus]|uniref:Short-chain dehydrogenase n=1 Tax=Talaromyces proteolyticus TaxID=1131652 RepID=A0AAD4PZA5_9EURO|nr:putative short-chain dehydrogenase [Talaromyces proteolyticus]KAH8695474.1 putative short-chain dehydrogenase [Talaromyces proteolyticus]